MIMGEITLIDHDQVEHQLMLIGDSDDTLMILLRDEGFDVEGTCAGSASCGTCHIYIETGTPGTRTVDELAVLDGLLHTTDNSRLACQIPLSDNLSGLTIRLAPNEY